MRNVICSNTKRFLSYNPGGLLKFSPKNVAVVQGKTGQKDLITEFLKQYYLAKDPLLVANNLSKHHQLMEFWLKDMRPEFTLMAVEPWTGKVLALAYNSVIKSDSGKLTKEKAAEELKDNEAFRMACFMADVTEKANLFERFNMKEHFETTFIATHQDAQRRGLAKYLVLHSKALGQSAGYPLVRMDCTNINSAKIAKRLNMEPCPRRQIVDYVDKNGKPWLATIPEPPNHHLDTFFTRLSNNLSSRLPPPKPTKKC